MPNDARHEITLQFDEALLRGDAVKAWPPMPNEVSHSLNATNQI